MSQSVPTGYIPRATPRKIFLGERILATWAFSLSNSPAPGQKMMVEFSGVGQNFPKLLAKILKKLRKLRDSTNFLFGELNTGWPHKLGKHGKPGKLREFEKL